MHFTNVKHKRLDKQLILKPVNQIYLKTTLGLGASRIRNIIQNCLEESKPYLSFLLTSKLKRCDIYYVS